MTYPVDPRKGELVTYKGDKICTFVPSEKTLASTGFLKASNKSSSLCDAIHAIQCVTRNKDIERGKKMMIQSEHKYICIGAYSSREKKGVESTHYSIKAV